MSRIRRGFTLVELIITLVIIGILAGIAWISYSALQARAKFGALKTTAMSVDHEATALAAADNQMSTDIPIVGAPSTYVEISLDQAMTAAGTNSAPAVLHDSWDGGDVTVEVTPLGTYEFRNTGGACVAYTPNPSTVGATTPEANFAPCV